MECGWESGSKGECGPLQYEQTLALKLRGGPGLPSQTVAGRRVYACPATPSGVVVLGKVIVNHQMPWKHLLIPGLRLQWSQRLAQLRIAASGSDVCPKHLVSWTPHCSLQNIVIQCLLSEHLKTCHQPSPAWHPRGEVALNSRCLLSLLLSH